MCVGFVEDLEQGTHSEVYILVLFHEASPEKLLEVHAPLSRILFFLNWHLLGLIIDFRTRLIFVDFNVFSLVRLILQFLFGFPSLGHSPLQNDAFILPAFLDPFQRLLFLLH